MNIPVLLKFHWSGLPFPSPGNLPDPEIEPMSLDMDSTCLLTLTLTLQILYCCATRKANIVC